MLGTNPFEVHTMLSQRTADMVARTGAEDAEDAVSPWQACTAGWGSNQVVGGLLLQTTRHTVVRSCQQRFSKFVTQCTYQQAVYDAATGQELVKVDVVDGLVPYGVDAVFLPTSSEYNAALAVGEYTDVNPTLIQLSEHVHSGGIFCRAYCSKLAWLQCCEQGRSLETSHVQNRHVISLTDSSRGSIA